MLNIAFRSNHHSKQIGRERRATGPWLVVENESPSSSPSNQCGSQPELSMDSSFIASCQDEGQAPSKQVD